MPLLQNGTAEGAALSCQGLATKLNIWKPASAGLALHNFDLSGNCIQADRRDSAVIPLELRTFSSCVWTAVLDGSFSNRPDLMKKLIESFLLSAFDIWYQVK